MHARTQNAFMKSMFRLPGYKKEELEIRKETFDVLAFCNLADIADISADTLPFGILKRIEISRALALHPKLLLLDEPVAGLNMTESMGTAELITKIAEHGISILLVEHDMNLVMSISDKVIVLNYGRKIAEGSPTQVQRDHEVMTAYLGATA
jgi:ABC-type branched-subunit amino acid transport system ATPase component